MGVAAIGVDIVLVTSGASAPDDPVQPLQALNPPLVAPSATAVLLDAAPAGRAGHWNLSPTRSAIGRAVSGTLGGRTPRVVESERARINGIVVGHDTAELRGDDGGGYQFEWYAAWARYELDEAEEAQRAANGIYWVGGHEGDIQSVYYLSDTGVGVWVGHYSAALSDQVRTGQLTALAERFVGELGRQGVPASRPVTRPEVYGDSANRRPPVDTATGASSFERSRPAEVVRSQLASSANSSE